MSDKLYAVFTPVKNFNGRRFDVVFTDGKGMATKRQANVLVKNWGYNCPELASTSSVTDDIKGLTSDDAKGSVTAPPASTSSATGNSPAAGATGNAPKVDGKDTGKHDKK